MLGEVEDERYVGVALYEGVPKGKRKGKQEFAMGQQMSNVIRSEPTVVACALNRPRFFLFTKREPVDTDDATVVRNALQLGTLSYKYSRYVRTAFRLLGGTIPT